MGVPLEERMGGKGEAGGAPAIRISDEKEEK